MGKAGDDYGLDWTGGRDFHLAWKSGIVLIPFWITSAFQTLGWVFIVFKPFGFTSWIAYAGGLALGVASGLWTLRAYRVTVLERSERGVIYWIRKRNAPVASAPAIAETDSGER